MGRTIAIIAATLLLVSCATQEGPPYYQSIPPLSQVPSVGVSFVIPDEEGWAFFDPDGKGSAIVKSGKTKIESYAISLDYFRQSSLKTEGEFREIYERLKRGEDERLRVPGTGPLLSKMS